MNNKFFKTFLAVLVGEIALVLLTTLAQEVLFNGISYSESSQAELIFGGLATFIAAVLAGYIAALIGGLKNSWPHLIISVLIIIEMSYLISNDLTKDPLWFDMLAGFSLILGVWIGLWFRFALKSKNIFKNKLKN